MPAFVVSLALVTAIFVSVHLPAARGSAQSAPPQARLLGDTLAESYQPEVNVSGSLIVGVMDAAAVAQLASDRLTVRPPPPLAGSTLCLRVTSRDGVYTSRNEYELPEASEVALPYDTAHREVLGGFRATEVAITATAGSCERAGADYVVAGGASDTVILFVNSFEATDVSFSVPAVDPDAATPCDEITEGRRTTFDFVCRVPRPDPEQLLEVHVERERFGRTQPTAKVRILGSAK